MNRYYFSVQESECDDRYFCADLFFSKLKAGRFVKDFGNYESASEFWRNEHNKYVHLKIVHHGKILN